MFLLFLMAGKLQSSTKACMLSYTSTAKLFDNMIHHKLRNQTDEDVTKIRWDFFSCWRIWKVVIWSKENGHALQNKWSRKIKDQGAT